MSCSANNLDQRVASLVRQLSIGSRLDERRKRLVLAASRRDEQWGLASVIEMRQVRSLYEENLHDRRAAVVSRVEKRRVPVGSVGSSSAPFSSRSLVIFTWPAWLARWRGFCLCGPCC